MAEKTIRHSYTQLSQIMLIDQANPAGNIHGGEVMKLMDTAASVAAIKHARCNVVTARVDELKFIKPIHVGDLVTCTSFLAYVGNSSMEVRVFVEVEDLSSGMPSEKALSGYFTMVALDKNGNTMTVPRLKLETDQERALFAKGQKRYEYYQRKRNAKS